jgi:hypothetical protein
MAMHAMKLWQVWQCLPTDDVTIALMSNCPTAPTHHAHRMYEETRSALLGQTQVVFYLVDLLQDKNKEVGEVGTCIIG